MPTDSSDSNTYYDRRNVVDSIKNQIEYRNTGTTIALIGEYGSGKTTCVEILNDKIEEENRERKDAETLILTYDAVSHIGDPIRRSFLQSLIELILLKIKGLQVRNKYKITVCGLLSAGQLYFKQVKINKALKKHKKTLARLAHQVTGSYNLVKKKQYSWPNLIGSLFIFVLIALYFVNHFFLHAQHKLPVWALHFLMGIGGLSALGVFIFNLVKNHLGFTVVISETQTPDNNYPEFRLIYLELLEIAKKLGYQKCLLIIENVDRLGEDKKLALLNLQSFIFPGAKIEDIPKIVLLLTYSEFDLLTQSAGNTDISIIEKLHPLYYHLPPFTNIHGSLYFQELLCATKFASLIPNFQSHNLDNVYDLLSYIYNLLHPMYIEDNKGESARDKLLTPRRLQTLVQHMYPIATFYGTKNPTPHKVIAKLVVAAVILMNIGSVRSDNNMKILGIINRLKDDVYVTSFFEGKNRWNLDVLLMLYNVTGENGLNHILDIFIKPTLEEILSYHNDDMLDTDNFLTLASFMPNLYKPIKQIFSQGNTSKILKLIYLICGVDGLVNDATFISHIQSSLVGTYSSIDFHNSSFDFNFENSPYSKYLMAYITLLERVDARGRERACNDLLIQFDKSYQSAKNVEQLLPYVDNIFEYKFSPEIFEEGKKFLMYKDVSDGNLIHKILTQWSSMNKNPLCSGNTSASIINRVDRFLTRAEDNKLNLSNGQELPCVRIVLNGINYPDSTKFKLIKSLCDIVISQNIENYSAQPIDSHHDLLIIIQIMLLWAVNTNNGVAIKKLSDQITILIDMLSAYIPDKNGNVKQLSINMAGGVEKTNKSLLALFGVTLLYCFVQGEMPKNSQQNIERLMRIQFGVRDDAWLFKRLIEENFLSQGVVVSIESMWKSA